MQWNQNGANETGCPTLATLLFLWLGWVSMHSTFAYLTFAFFVELAYLFPINHPPA
jgi:hypothetical protein